MAGFFYLIPGVFLLRYGNAITRVPDSGQSTLEDVLRRQKSLWKYVGLFTIVMLVTYVLLVIGIIVFAVVYGSMPHP